MKSWTRNSILLLSYSLLFFSCSYESEDSEVVRDNSTRETDSSITETTYFPVSIGMTNSEVKSRFHECELNKVNGYKYGILGGGTGTEVIQNDEVLFFYWNHWKNNHVIGYILLSKDYSMYDNIRVGSTMKDILKEHPHAVTFIDQTTGYEGCMLEDMGYAIYFSNQKDQFMGEYDWQNRDAPVFLKLKDSSRVSTSIWIFK